MESAPWNANVFIGCPQTDHPFSTLNPNAAEFVPRSNVTIQAKQEPFCPPPPFPAQHPYQTENYFEPNHQEQYQQNLENRKEVPQHLQAGSAVDIQSPRSWDEEIHPNPYEMPRSHQIRGQRGPRNRDFPGRRGFSRGGTSRSHNQEEKSHYRPRGGQKQEDHEDSKENKRNQYERNNNLSHSREREQSKTRNSEAQRQKSARRGREFDQQRKRPEDNPEENWRQRNNENSISTEGPKDNSKTDKARRRNRSKGSANRGSSSPKNPAESKEENQPEVPQTRPNKPRNRRRTDSQILQKTLKKEGRNESEEDGMSTMDRLRADELSRRAKKDSDFSDENDKSARPSTSYNTRKSSGDKLIANSGGASEDWADEVPVLGKTIRKSEPIDPRMVREKLQPRGSTEGSTKPGFSEGNFRQTRADDPEDLDKDFVLWENRWSEIQEFKVVEEIQGDLFEQPKEYSLAHCVAEDLRMGSGIAVAFKREFKNLPDLLDQRVKQGGLATLHDEANNRYVYYLVTKRESSGKPTYHNLWRSLRKMKEHIKEHEVKKLAVPRLGCGLDRLEWDRVKSMMESLFKDADVEIKVCNFQQNEQIEDSKSKCKLVIQNSPITKIEAGTLILYFTTSRGDQDDTIKHLSEKFNFWPSFQNHTPKEPGEIVYFEDKIQNFGLCGCIVRSTDADPLSFASLLKCLQKINKMNKQFGGDAFDYVALQWLDEEAYFDCLVNQKVITMLVNVLRLVDVYICNGSFKEEETVIPSLGEVSLSS